MIGAVEPLTPWALSLICGDALVLAWGLCGGWVLHRRHLLALAALSLAGLGVDVSWVIGSHEMAAAVFGMTCMAVIFVLGLGLIRSLLSFGWPVLGVARTVVDEAVRMKMVLVFIVGLFVLVSVLPFLLDPNELLRYRIQFFLKWALSISTWF